VVDEVRGLGRDAALLVRVLDEAQASAQAELAAARGERKRLTVETRGHQRRLRDLATCAGVTAGAASRIAELHEQVAYAERRLPELDARIAELEREVIDRDEAAAAFAGFDPVWQNLIPREQARLLKLLISVVEYDGENQSVSVTFRPTSIRSMVQRSRGAAA